MYQLGRTFEAALFDMDGTLVDSTAAITATWTRWARRVGLHPADILRHCHGRPARSTIAALAPHLDADAEAAWMLSVELADRAVCAPIAGAATFLRHLDVPWAVVTSANEVLARRRMGRARLPEPEVLVGIDRLSRGKPDPEGYLFAAAELGVRPCECLVFEDSPVGISAARRAGMSVIALATTHQPLALFADAIVDDYSSLLPPQLRELPVVREPAPKVAVAAVGRRRRTA